LSLTVIWPAHLPKAEPMQVSATLLLELGVILTVLTVLGTAARRFALSPIPLYLAAGLALGEGGIAPIPAATQFVSTGASIGVVLLLLTLGLEFSIGEFASSLRRHLPSAWVDVLLNAVPGALPGWLLGLNGVGILALAGVTYISSSGVIARLLSDLRRLGNRETPAVLSILVLEDFAMAAYLPLLAVLAAGGSWRRCSAWRSPSRRSAWLSSRPTGGAITSAGSSRTLTTSRCCCASSV
jgi:monovalent cation:H+ antiporter-2, CPA2 family